MRAALALEQRDFAARRGQAQADHGTGEAAADDQMLGLIGCLGHGVFLRATQSLAGFNARISTAPAARPAEAHMLRHSDAMKERATDTGPSYCTKG